jgi:hypothetical protein
MSSYITPRASQSVGIDGHGLQYSFHRPLRSATGDTTIVSGIRSYIRTLWIRSFLAIRRVSSSMSAKPT